MKQIVNGVKYIHNKNIIHRDLKSDNIMLEFSNNNDIKNLNIMNTKIKIIDFGFAIILKNDNLAYSALGTEIYCDPLILKKFKHVPDFESKGYSKEIDIWSLGVVCYEMLIGHVLFNANSFNELIDKVERGYYQIPTDLSKEVVSFLNGMLQTDKYKRLNIEQLENHPFLKKRVSDFTRISVGKLSNKITNDQLNINIHRNKSIWSIFNKNDEQKLIKISPTYDYINNSIPIPEESEKYSLIKTDNIYDNIKLKKKNSINYNNIQLRSFYGEDMFPNNKNQNNNNINS